MLRQRVRHLLQRPCRVARRSQIQPACPVDLYVDQSRRQPALLDHDVGITRRRSRLESANTAIGNLDARRGERLAIGDHSPPQRADRPGHERATFYHLP
jgi:hypothetical protein